MRSTGSGIWDLRLPAETFSQLARSSVEHRSSFYCAYNRVYTEEEVFHKQGRLILAFEAYFAQRGLAIEESLLAHGRLREIFVLAV